MNKKTVSIAAYEALKEQGMKIGSMVKILAAWPEKSEGFDAYWPEDMNETVGKIGKVTNITVDQDEVRVSVSIPGSDYWWYPTMVLSLVESKPTLFEVNEKISLSNFDETARTASITIKGDSNVREVTYASINALYKAINPEPKKIKFAEEYEANINHTTRTVSIGCQSVSFKEIERVYKRINQITDFSVGDTVEYCRQPTATEWEHVGRVDIPFSIGQKLVIRRINKSTGSLEFEGSIFCYPKQAFKYA
jgi:hypothetical protein